MMTQEEKQLLLKDLCARLPYQTMILTPEGDMELEHAAMWTETVNGYLVEDNKPYLRPLSSMTKEEDKEWQLYKSRIAESCDELLEKRITEFHDWCYANHIDFCGLIERGLALEAPKDMYDIK